MSKQSIKQFFEDRQVRRQARRTAKNVGAIRAGLTERIEQAERQGGYSQAYVELADAVRESGAHKEDPSLDAFCRIVYAAQHGDNAEAFAQAKRLKELKGSDEFAEFILKQQGVV
jgi:phenolic acid decarboxylase